MFTLENKEYNFHSVSCNFDTFGNHKKELDPVSHQTDPDPLSLVKYGTNVSLGDFYSFCVFSNTVIRTGGGSNSAWYSVQVPTYISSFDEKMKSHDTVLFEVRELQKHTTNITFYRRLFKCNCYSLLHPHLVT